jgi:DNA-binding MarR family transcriptional regulator
MHATDDQLRGEVGSLVLQFIAGVVLHNQVVAQRLGLGASDSQFLSLLAVHGPLSPRQLVDLTGLSSGTVTGVLDRLETAGYIHRDRDTTDKRKVLVTPNPDAQARLAEHYADHGAHMSAVLNQRGTTELQIIATFLQDMVDTPSASTNPNVDTSFR